jgi:uncharacterized protein YqjF (DUF2071 family)
MRQSWCDLLFAHWPASVASLRPFVPPALEIEEHDGTSWIGLVPFRMQGVMVRPLPDLPGISAFPELNLRLYVRAGGKPGVWFISLDAANDLAVWAARRFFHLPYFRADMSAREEAGRVHYRTVRRGDGPRVAFQAEFGPESGDVRARPGSLEHFLTERYCLYTCDRAGALVRAEVHHAPWPLQLASADIVENTIGDAQGLPLAGPPALLHFSRRLDVVIWPTRRVLPDDRTPPDRAR